VATTAERERVADGLGLRRPLFEQRSGECAPFELQPKAAFGRVELEVGGIRRREAKAGLDAVK
jgi:hypothetical protein